MRFVPISEIRKPTLLPPPPYSPPCRTVNTCLLCSLIGHRWVTRLNYTIDGVSYRGVQVFGACMRCGRPRPQELRCTS